MAPLMQTSVGMNGEPLLDAILELSPIVRYAALHLGGGEPLLRERVGTPATSAEGERWDELVVNPTLIELASRRGDVDLDGLDFLLVRYGRAFSLVLPVDGGHLSVLLEPGPDPLPLVAAIRGVAARHGVAFRR